MILLYPNYIRLGDKLMIHEVVIIRAGDAAGEVVPIDGRLDVGEIDLLPFLVADVLATMHILNAAIDQITVEGIVEIRLEMVSHYRVEGASVDTIGISFATFIDANLFIREVLVMDKLAPIYFRGIG